MTLDSVCSPSIPKSPPLIARWFHAIDSPIVDPIAIRKAKREKTLANIAVRSTVSSSASSVSSVTSSTSSTVRAPPKQWVPFSKRDTMALEKAFQGNHASTVPVNEDYLFEVNITKREISPVYWEGPIYEVRRATWFMQGDGSKWLPCEENMSRQVEQGYQKYKPYLEPIVPETELELGNDKIIDAKTNEKEKDIGESTESKPIVPEKKEPEQILEEKEYLLGPYLGKYVIYTDACNAWLLHDTPSAIIAKNILTKITNNQNLGGTKLIRGYLEVEREKRKKTEEGKKTETVETIQPSKKQKEVDAKSKVVPEEENEERKSLDTGDLSRKARGISPLKKKELDDIEMTKQQAEDYDNEESEEELRNIDQVIFVIHGIGQQMSERLGQNFVHDVNVFRKTLKSTWPIAVSGNAPLDRPNGIQVLPILWRKGMLFGSENSDEEGPESDLGLLDGDDGCPTIDEITLDGAPNIRTLVSDVFLDIPLYLTSRYHGQMMNIVIKEANRVYRLFIERNPHFLENKGQVSILAHSLGSLLAFDILTAQPFTPNQLSNVNTTAAVTEKRSATLDFPIKNFFAIGSPLGMIMVLRGHKMVSRKTLEHSSSVNNTPHTYDDKSAPVSFVYPATDNIYNIFHKSDPVAYRLEPLIVRHYGSKLKPFPIPYIKGGLKSVLDHGYTVTHDFANRAGAMFESLKSGITGNLIMRGLGFSKPLEEAYPGAELQYRSGSDPAILASRAEAKSAAKLKSLNPNGRIDFYLQEGLLENTYISALSVHMSYWQDVDVAGFLTREVYKNQQLEQEQEKNNT
ncbi:hypothetical protein INT48_003588, partial [Thamnidium elegans]